MPTTTPATTTPPTDDLYGRFTALSDLYGRHDGPDDRSGGLDCLVTAAHAARDAYDELDEQCYQVWRIRPGEMRTDNHQAASLHDLLQATRDVAYEMWQQLERLGLPLLQAWQRETLGYSEEEVTTMQQNSNETINGVTFTIEACASEPDGFYPTAHTQDGRTVYLGGEDDEDCETPEQAIEQGRRLLRDQAERGNLSLS